MSAALLDHPNLRCTADGPVARLVVDRPDALGALSRSMLEALRDLWRRLEERPDVRVLVVTGTGKGFVAGADISEYDGVGQEQFDAYQRLGRDVFDTLARLPQYTVAAVNGYALGGGFEIALCCDEIYAVERARFGLPEVKLGLLPGGGGSQRLSRALGTRFTKRLLVTGAMVPAPELYRRGLLSAVLPDADALLAAVDEHAAAVAANAPLAVARAKRLVDDHVGEPLDEALAAEQRVLSGLFATSDAHEGVAAFIGKRPPEFTGT